MPVVISRYVVVKHHETVESWNAEYVEQAINQLLSTSAKVLTIYEDSRIGHYIATIGVPFSFPGRYRHKVMRIVKKRSI